MQGPLRPLLSDGPMHSLNLRQEEDAIWTTAFCTGKLTCDLAVDAWQHVCVCVCSFGFLRMASKCQLLRLTACSRIRLACSETFMQSLPFVHVPQVAQIASSAASNLMAIALDGMMSKHEHSIAWLDFAE